MKVWQRVLGSAIAVLAIVVLLVLLGSYGFSLAAPYLWFTHRSPAFYSQLAQACDQVLQQHPPGPNANIVRTADGQSYTFVRLQGDDLTLPKAIRNLRPWRVTISTNRVYVMVGESRDGYGVSWSPDGFDPFTGGQTNVWNLVAHGEDISKVVYTQAR